MTTLNESSGLYERDNLKKMEEANCLNNKIDTVLSNLNMDLNSLDNHKRSMLYTATRFIHLLNSDLKIHSLNPDSYGVVLKRGEDIYSLEIHEITNKNKIEYSASILNLLREVEIDYVNNYPGHLYHIYIKLNIVSFQRSQKKEMKDGIINEINAAVNSVEVENRHLKEISILPLAVKKFRIFYLFDQDYESSITTAIIKETIKNEERRLSKSSRRKFKEYRLLLVLSPEYNPEAVNTQKHKINTDILHTCPSFFDKIYILSRDNLLFLKK